MPKTAVIPPTTPNQAYMVASHAYGNHDMTWAYKGDILAALNLALKALQNTVTGNAKGDEVLRLLRVAGNIESQPHPHIGVGQCPICRHYGKDCTGDKAMTLEDVIEHGLPVDDGTGVKTEQCAHGNHETCPDVDANCCECSCHWKGGR